MFSVRNIPIQTPALEVMMQLKEDLRKQGINRFKNIKASADNIQMTCPIHKNGQERTPSCGVRITEGGITQPGTVHCFTCGYIASLEVMISDCFGYTDDNGGFGEKWLLKNFILPNRTNREYEFALSNFEAEKITKEVKQFESLTRYKKKHPYMYERKLTDAIIDNFEIGFDEHFTLSSDTNSVTIPCLTFPVRDKQGNVLFIARRAVDRKFFNYPSSVNKPVYGLYELSDDADEVIVCESIINALTCYVYGKSAVALLGLGTKKQYDELARLNCRKLIIGFDGDEAGEKATLRLYRELCNRKLITRLELPIGKDINDLTKKEFEELNESFV